VKSETPERARMLARSRLLWTDLLQLAKTVVAGVIAWVLADQVFALPQAFLAPWSALLVVHATVYRTFSRGLQQVSTAVLGVLLAWSVGNLLGLSVLAVAVLLTVGLALGALRWFRDESTTVAATALIVLTTGFSRQDQLLVDRLFDTAIGIVVGLLVNLVVWPPLRDYSAARAINRVDAGVGELLTRIAEQLHQGCGPDAAMEWVGRTRELDAGLDEAWALLRQARESSRLNPRRAAKGLKQTDGYEQVLRNDEQAVAETRSMARTLAHSIEDVIEWDATFRGRWLGLLEDLGAAIRSPDADRITQVRAELAKLTNDMSTQDLSARHWPEYGALIMNLRNVATSMDRVVEANPVLPSRYQRRDGVLRG
jgi:uncharacterized membrane protein YccC